MDRDEFYNEQVKVFKETGKPSRAVEVINIFLFDEGGELFVQKRSNQKRHNPGLLDKSIGGHINNNDSADFTVMVETVQELQVPSVVLRSEKDFKKTLALLNKYLSTVAIIQHVETRIVEMEKILDDEKIVIANKTHFYFGVYGGRIKTVDKEAKGILQYSIEDLKKEMEKYPEMFTSDLREYIGIYSSEFEKFVNSIF